MQEIPLLGWPPLLQEGVENWMDRRKIGKRKEKESELVTFPGCVCEMLDHP